MGPVRFSSPFSPFALHRITIVLSAAEKISFPEHSLSKERDLFHRTNKKKTQVWDD